MTSRRTLLLVSFAAALVVVASPATAQYMYLDANGNGVHDSGDRLAMNGSPTTVDVWMVTDHNRDGSPVVCPQDPDAPMSLVSYVVSLEASGGTVSYGGFTTHIGSVAFGEFNPGDGTHYKNGFGQTFFSPPGTYRLCTLTITGLAGTPRVDIVDYVPGSTSTGGGPDVTSFGSTCFGNEFDNTYKLAGPHGGSDWTDVDGLDMFVINEGTPVLAAIGNKTVNEGSLLSFTATATDPDPSQTLTFLLDTGAPSGASITSAGVFTWTPTEGQGPGVYPITVRVVDSSTPVPGTDSETIQVTVNEVNVAPVLAAITDKTIMAGNTLSFTATATDTDLPANTLTFSLDPGAPAGATITAGGIFSWPVPVSQVAGVSITVRVTDNGAPALSDTKSFFVTVLVHETGPPVITNPGNKTVNEGSCLNFTVTATSSGGGTLTFSLGAGAPAGATITAGGQFNWCPTEAQGPGNYPITVNCSDGASSSSASFVVAVLEVNQVPVLNPIGNKTGPLGALLTFTATATDADIPANTLAFSLDPGAPAGATIGVVTGVFSWTPTTSGSIPVTIRVTDNGTPPLSDSETIVINVCVCANTAPVLAAIGSKTVNEGALLSFTATATDPDVPPQTLTFSLGAGAPAGAAITAGGALTWTPTEAQGPGTFPITVIVTDNGPGNLIDSETIQVTVNEVNLAPVLNQIGNKTGVIGAPLTFTATGTDADLPANTLTFSLDPGAPASATIDPATGAFTWTPTSCGTFPVTIRVTDNGSPPLSDAEAILIVLGCDAPPVLNAIGNKTVNEGSCLIFTATATAPNGSPVTFYLPPGAPPGATITTGGQFNWCPTEAQGPGVRAVTVCVRDNVTQLTDCETIQVTVNEVNLAPVLAPIGNKEGCPGVPVAFTATATDADVPANALAFSIDPGAPPGATINPSTGAFTWTAQAGGAFPFTIRVTDNGSPPLSDSETIVITVLLSPPVPVLQQPVNMTVAAETVADQELHATDRCANPLTFSKVSGPAFVTVTTIDATTGRVHVAPTANDVGSYPVTVAASNAFASDQKTFTVTVTQGGSFVVLNPIGDKTVTEGALLTFTASATTQDGSGATFSLSGTIPLGASITSAGGFMWTPTERQGGQVWPVTVCATAGFQTDCETFNITVIENNIAPVLNTIGNKSGYVGVLLSFTATATDADIPASTLTFSLDPGAPVGAAITAGGTFTWTPAAVGNYLATVRVTDDGSPPRSDSETITISVQSNPHPVLLPIADMTLSEGTVVQQTVVGSDPGNAPFTFTKVSGPLWMTVATTSATTGLITLSPDFTASGDYVATVRASIGTAYDEKSFSIHVTNTCRPPVAHVGGPYSGAVGAPIQFNGASSFSPDGDALTYLWSFGDGDTGSGVAPMHVYSALGTYTVELQVVDGCSLTDTDVTTATVSNCLPAFFYAIGGKKVMINLTTGKSTDCLQVESVLNSFAVEDVDLASIVMRSPNTGSVTEIHAQAGGKTSVGGDRNGNGADEITVCFGKEDLRRLFSNLNATQTVDVTLEGNVLSGGKFCTTQGLQVKASNGGGGSLTASISPNPLNPSATLTFHTDTRGPLLVQLFDVRGRLLRTLREEQDAAAGYHDVRIDGTSSDGTRLASGVYYLRIRAGGVDERKAITILK